jgi:hypothetical protein
LIASRTFIVRFSQADRSVVLENSLTRERVGLHGLSEVAAQIERWLVELDERQGGEACTRTEAGSGY